MTSLKQTFLFTKEELTSLQEDSLANPTQVQGKGLERPMKDTSFLKCLEQLKRLNPDGLLAKMFVDLLVGEGEWYSTRCALTWKGKDMKFNRFLFQLQVKTPHTKENEYGSLLLKTPTRMDGEVSSGKKNPTSGNSGTLAQEIMSQYKPTMIKLGLLPTPNCTRIDIPTMEEVNKRKEIYGGERRAMYLTHFIAMGFLPTPMASDHHGGTAKLSEKFDRRSNLKHNIAQKVGKASQLHPAFVEEMMGFPTNWTLYPFLNGVKNQSQDTETL
jgi:hypothetical protein